MVITAVRNAFATWRSWKRLLLVLLLFIYCSTARPQSLSHLMASNKSNFSTFTSRYRPTREIQFLKKGFGSLPPDADFLDKQIPSTHAMEVYSKRTVDSKQYVDLDSPSIVYVKKSLGPMHYWKDGHWLTIDERLEPKNDGILEASHLEEPIGIDVRKKKSYIHSLSGTILCNDWSLLGVKLGKESILARADWSDYSAGDDGIRVRNIFPGIDAEIQVFQVGLKTSFIIHKNKLPGYDTYIFRDFFSGKGPGKLISEKTTSDIPAVGAVDYIVNGKTVLRIQKASMYGEKSPADTYHSIAYRVRQHELSMVVAAADVNLLLAESDVILDPFISTVNSVALFDIIGSQYNADCSQMNTCDYALSVPGLPGASVIDVRYSFSYLATPPCMLKDGSYSIVTGTCVAGNITSPNPNSYGPSVANDVSLLVDFPVGCFPPPSCKPPNFLFLFRFARTCKGVPGCDGSCIGAISPFTILVRGDVVLNVPVVKVSSSALFACSGDSIQFTAEPTNGGAIPTYQWLLNGLPVGTNSPAYANSSLVSTDSVSCVMVSSLNTGCPGNTDTSGAVRVTIDPSPTIHINTSDSNICSGDPVNFQAETTNIGDFPTYQWMINGVPAGPNAAAFSTHSLSNGDLVSARVIAQTGCTRPTASDNEISMIVRNVPVITPGPDFAIEQGDSVRLASTVSGNIADYSWNPSLGLNNPSILNPIASPPATILYKLVATEISGCMDSANVIVKVLIHFKMPNAFTPNEDGKNELFRVPPGGLLTLQDFSVFNRWGERVFFTNDPGKGWDGSFRGKPCSEGTYVYIIHGADLRGKVSLKGTVSLIR